MKKIILLFTVALLVVSCNNNKKDSDNPLKLNALYVNMASGDTHQITSSNGWGLSYASEDEYVATVNESGKISAERVGATRIRVSTEKNNAYVYVYVNPSSTLYEEPHLDWGISKTTFRSKYGFDTSEDEKLIYNFANDAASQYIYTFKKDKLVSAVVRIKSNFSTEIEKFLNERYVLIGYNQKDNLLEYADAIERDDYKLHVVATVYNVNYWSVLYYEYTEILGGDNEGGEEGDGSEE